MRPRLHPLRLVGHLRRRLTLCLNPPDHYYNKACTEFGFPGKPTFSGSSLRPRVPCDTPVPDAQDDVRHDDVCMGTVCTVNHVHQAAVLLETFTRHHPDAHAIVAVVDWDGRENLPLAGATVVTGRELGAPLFPWLALKYSALHLCCAMKPYLLRYMAAHSNCAKLLYLDSDMMVFGPFDELLARLEDADFVVTPHMREPYHRPHCLWERPTIGDVADAGMLNAGLIGMKVNGEALRFCSTWEGLVSNYGAFMPELGAQAEQNSFNWVTCFTENVHIFRDPTYNVAYWNLHERSLRWGGLDRSDDSDAWFVDGRPLKAYHFSGYSVEAPFKLSKHDRRYRPNSMPSVSALLDHYHLKLRECGADGYAQRPYAFDTFSSGIEIDSTMRNLFKQFEDTLHTDIDPWTQTGERYYCRWLLSPVPASGSLIPILFKSLYESRPDLVAEFPRAHLQPERLVAWIAEHGIGESATHLLFDLHRPAVPSGTGMATLESLKASYPDLFRGLNAPVSANRRNLIHDLHAAGERMASRDFQVGRHEHYYITTVGQIRALYEERRDLQKAFPDPFHGDAERFTRWLRLHGTSECYLSEDAASVFASCCRGRSLARIFSYMDRDWTFMERFPLALVGRDAAHCARMLLMAGRLDHEYSVEDVAMYVWMMDRAPWSGLALTLELGVNARQTPSPLLPEGQEALLAPVLESAPEFARELQRYRRAHSDARTRFDEAYVRRHQNRHSREVNPHDHLAALRSADGPGQVSCPAPDHLAPSSDAPVPGGRPGVNLFGHFKSAIGLGTMCRGLRTAMQTRGIATTSNILGHDDMSPDLCPDDFIRRYDYSLNTNVFTLTPVHADVMLNRLPEAAIRGKRNIAYLAWEQRDGCAWWKQVFDDYDQVWALSDFAATALSRWLERDVAVVPCVLDFDRFPTEAASKADFALPEERFCFAYAFDADSSCERKNPEAVIESFKSAFPAEEDVLLILKVGHGKRISHRPRVAEIAASAASLGDRVRIMTEPMTRTRVLQFLSVIDCYVSLHHSEGFGLTCAEAMAYGKPVIATGYSGNTTFMNDRNSFLVGYREALVTVPHGPYQKGSVWADPDIAHAAALMRYVYTNREAARSVGETASAAVRAQLSPRAVGRTVDHLLGFSEAQGANDSKRQNEVAGWRPHVDDVHADIRIE